MFKGGKIMSFETVSVIGLGYIGLPTAAMFASRKKTVIGVDINQHTVNTINKGEAVSSTIKNPITIPNKME